MTLVDLNIPSEFHESTMARLEAVILLKDIQGKIKSLGSIGGLCRSSSKTICHGELLSGLPRVKIVPCEPVHNYQLANDPAI